MKIPSCYIQMCGRVLAHLRVVQVVEVDRRPLRLHLPLSPLDCFSLLSQQKIPHKEGDNLGIQRQSHEIIGHGNVSKSVGSGCHFLGNAPTI